MCATPVLGCSRLALANLVSLGHICSQETHKSMHPPNHTRRIATTEWNSNLSHHLEVTATSNSFDEVPLSYRTNSPTVLSYLSMPLCVQGSANAPGPPPLFGPEARLLLISFIIIMRLYIVSYVGQDHDSSIDIIQSDPSCSSLQASFACQLSAAFHHGTHHSAHEAVILLMPSPTALNLRPRIGTVQAALGRARGTRRLISTITAARILTTFHLASNMCLSQTYLIRWSK